MNVPRKHDRLFSARHFGLLLAGVLILTYYRVLFGGETFFYRDFGALAIPTAAFHKAAILNGEIPFWNPFSNCGAPFLAQWGTMALYPLSAIYLLLPLPWSLNLFCIFHLWLGGMGMYLLARRWSGQEWAGAFAGVAFVFNGITQASLAWPNYVAAIAWFPWVFLLTEQLWMRENATSRHASGRRGLVTAALASTMQLLAGVPELSVLTWMLIVVFFLAQIALDRPRAKKLMISFGLLIALTTGLVSVQLLPFCELFESAYRVPAVESQKWALPLWGWANLVLPRFRTFITPQGTAFQYQQSFLASVYLGAPLLLLAGCALLRRSLRTGLLMAVAFLAAALALGPDGVVYTVVTTLFPPLQVARYPIKFIFLLSFIVPLLAAMGAASLAALLPARRERYLLVVGSMAVLSLFALVVANHLAPLELDRLDEFRQNSAFRIVFAVLLLVAIHFALTAGRTQRLARFAFLALFIADGTSHLKNLNPVISSSVFKGELWSSAQKLPKPTLGEGRVFITPDAEQRLLLSAVPNNVNDLIGKRLAEWSQLNLLDRVPKVNGASRLQLREAVLLQNAVYTGTNGNLEAWLTFLNVRYQSSSNSPVEWARRSAAMPMVTGGQQPVFESEDLLEQPFDFGTEVAFPGVRSALTNIRRADVSVSNLQVKLNELRFDANASAPSLAVIAQTWFPAWKAEVIHDGHRSIDSVLRANGAFQCVLLPAGKSQVRVYYADRSFVLGSAISAATLLVCVCLWLRKEKHSSHE